MDRFGKGHPSVNPRCPKCGSTSDRLGPNRFKCRPRYCGIAFAARDPDYAHIVIGGDGVAMGDDVGAALIRGEPTPHPHCPVCGGTSDQVDSIMPGGAPRFKCRVRECRIEFEV